MDSTNEYEVGSSSNNKNPSKRKAQEPDEYANREKKCNQCGQSNIVYKFLNNKNIKQPRYQCLNCSVQKGKNHFFNPFPIRQHVHKDGYAKLPKVEPEELKNKMKVCDHCLTVNYAIFRGYNNGKRDQPRYACKACKKQFSPLKHSKARGVMNIESLNESQTGSQQLEVSHQISDDIPHPQSYPQTQFQNEYNPLYNVDYAHMHALYNNSSMGIGIIIGTDQFNLPYNTCHVHTHVYDNNFVAEIVVPNSGTSQPSELYANFPANFPKEMVVVPNSGTSQPSELYANFPKEMVGMPELSTEIVEKDDFSSNLETDIEFQIQSSEINPLDQNMGDIFGQGSPGSLQQPEIPYECEYEQNPIYQQWYNQHASQ